MFLLFDLKYSSTEDKGMEENTNKVTDHETLFVEQLIRPLEDVV